MNQRRRRLSCLNSIADGGCQRSCPLGCVEPSLISGRAGVAARHARTGLRQGVDEGRRGDHQLACLSTWMDGATVLAAAKVQYSPSSPCSLRCAWLRVAARFPSPALRAAAGREPGRGGKAGVPVDLESRSSISPTAARAARSGLSVTGPIGCQFRVSPVQRDGLAARAAA